MKTLVTMLSVVAISLGAFAQGKVAFSNGSTHIITYTTAASGLMPADTAKLGTAIANDSSFKAELWYNTSGGSGVPAAESSLVRYNSTWTLSSGANGFLPGTSLTLNGAGNAPVAIGSGVYGTFEIKVFSAAYTSYADAYQASLSGAAYTGLSPVFTCAAGNVAANQLYQTTTTAFSSWSSTAGPIYVATVPEPATFALAGLGAAALMIFRRRK